MVFEQIVRIALIMAALGAFMPGGLAASCFGIILCCMISETLSCAFAFMLYLIDARRSAPAPREPGALRKLAGIALPVALTGYLRAAFKTAENVLIPSGLRASGRTEGQALSQYALIGMSMPVLFFPSGILAAAATLLIPEASEARAARNEDKVKRIFARTFRLTVLFSLLFGVLFTTLGGKLGELIYRNPDAGALITALAPLVPLMYLDSVVDALLTGLNQQMRTLRINMLDYTLRIGLILLLIPRFGLVAYIGVLYFSTVLNATLSIRRLLIASRCRIDYPLWVWGPLLSAAIAGGLTVLLAHLLQLGGGVVDVTLQALLIAVFYIVLLRLTRCLTREDLRWIRDVTRTAKQRKAV
jgi:stage V sporulation protein B